MNENNKVIAKNTFFMYIRMGVSMLVGLYTSRVVLNVLGVEDYGLYNVIGGIVALFSVLNSAMVNTTSRFVTVSLANGNIKETSDTFNMAFLIHLVVGLIILILGETVGLWYLHNKLVIPEGREYAAEWLYQFSIISTVLVTINVPFNATVVAHEKLNFFALEQIVVITLKLIIVLLLTYSPYDKLIFYGSALLAVSIAEVIAYLIFCRIQFEEVRFHYYWSVERFREMMKFIGWAIIGNFSSTFYSQGINLLLNAFCGPAVNAARGIAVQVEGLVKQFANNIQTAINPQILKNYATGELDRMYSLIMASSRYCFYFMFILSLPIFIETDFLLTLWLGNVPDHTTNFIRIILLSVLLDAFVNPMFTANLASGKLAIYHGTLAILMYAFMFVTYFAIKTTNIPESVFICYLLACVIGYILRIFILNHQVGLKPTVYIRQVLAPVSWVVLVSIIPPVGVHLLLKEGWSDFLLTSTTAVFSVAVAVSLFGITEGERNIAISFVRRRISNYNDKLSRK